ncbi:MAG: hypothetical protein ACFFEA_14470 [Candidatus Thorarchaeota archaeon]
MNRKNKTINQEATERLEFWSAFLNSDEGRLVVGDLNEDEMKKFHADGFLFELTKGKDKQILVKLVGKE